MYSPSGVRFRITQATNASTITISGSYGLTITLGNTTSVTFPTSGTLITFEDDHTMEKAVISGVAFSRDEAKITVMGVPDRPGIAARIFGDFFIMLVCRQFGLQHVAAFANAFAQRFVL